jgi:hypothetical protein
MSRTSSYDVASVIYLALMPGLVDGVGAGPIPGEAAADTGLLATRPILPGETLVKETVGPGP